MTPSTNTEAPREPLPTRDQPVDVITSRDGTYYRAEIKPGFVGVGPTELDAVIACASKALTQVTDIRQVFSCTKTRSRTGLYVATNRTLRRI